MVIIKKWLKARMLIIDIEYGVVKSSGMQPGLTLLFFLFKDPVSDNFGFRDFFWALEVDDNPEDERFPSWR